MGRHGKRKYSDYRNDNKQHAAGISDALGQVKRSRLSPEGPVTNGIPSRAKTDDGGWETVKSRHARKKDKKPLHQNHPAVLRDHESGPLLYFHHQQNKDLQIKDLRDLVLYILADGVGPTWAGVKNSRAIKKVAVMMLPGLDQQILKRGEELLRTKPNDQLANDGQKLISIDEDDPLDEENMKDETVSADKRNSKIENFRWLFENTRQVYAPGDPRHSKVHSPLQAMLMKSSEDTARNQGSQNDLRKFKAIPTPVTNFVHSADELRDAEYPVHPAAFTANADAVLEASRRKATGQVESDGWVDSDVSTSSPVLPLEGVQDQLSQGLQIYALDCEMVLTTDEKSSLARISLVSWPDGAIVIDKFVKPELDVTNYFTQYSGITPDILKDVTTTLSDVQAELKPLLTPSTILLGHSLESDLNALKLTHPFLVDTAIIYPHPRGLPLRSSLKFLANKYLKREIQTAGANGHNSVEDARAVLDLVKLKCEKGPLWGTTEANGETLFKKLARNTGVDKNPLTTAIVEYGTPERGFGKDATVTIGCQDDQEIINGLLQALYGDPDNESIPANGVNFAWSRLRALEYARGWVTGSNNGGHDTNSAPDTYSSASTLTSFDEPLLATLSHLQTIHKTLSESPVPTLLILYSGTSDMRPVMYYQNMQQQYRKEFKVKKWDELSVRWTDEEEQALKRAVEEARRGWGWVGLLGGGDENKKKDNVEGAEGEEEKLNKESANIPSVD